MFPNVPWGGAREGRIAQVEMEPKGRWDAGPTPRDTGPSLWFLCIASGRTRRCICVFIHSAVLLSTCCTPGPGTGKYPESIWGGGLPGTGPSDSTGEVWKSQCLCWRKGTCFLKAEREDTCVQSLVHRRSCSAPCMVQQKLTWRVAQCKASHLPAASWVPSHRPPPPPHRDLCPRQEKPTALIRPSWGWMVCSGLCYFQIIRVAPAGMLHKRRKLVTSCTLKNLCPHLHAFSLSVILQVKIMGSPEYICPYVRGLKKFSNVSSGWITENIGQNWK